MSSAWTISDFFGYASIGCWLGAQFPQVVENYQRQSCEGLSFPFLLNWLAGDFSNLVGCILTKQLPFQTYLATYFVFVDLTLVVQFFYYDRTSKSAIPRPLSSARRVSVERPASRYRTLSAVAANVAATAALAAQQDEAEHRRRRHNQRASIDRGYSDYSARDMTDLGDEDEVDEGALAALADSFHSERGHDARRKATMGWSLDRNRRRSGSVGQMPTSSLAPIDQAGESFADPAIRGRPSIRDIDLDIQPDPTSPSRRTSRVGKRSGTMVFLGVWALLGLGTFAGAGRRVLADRSSTDVGRVLAPRAHDVSNMGEYHVPVLDSNPEVYDTKQAEEDYYGAHLPPSQQNLLTEPWSERVIGRIFAWVCTALYLTSRLPQIWKNYSRKSVEGLSMYLFVFAFLGNVFYVASILSSPKMGIPGESAAFIRETIPFLLGSAGTLTFDITIVSQSFIYRPKARRSSIVHSSRYAEEGASLLGSDALAHPTESTTHNRGRGSRTRSNV